MAGQRVPLGTLVDATKGTVTLTSASSRSGATSTGQFYAGVFRVTQSGTLTVLDVGRTPATGLQTVPRAGDPGPQAGDQAQPVGPRLGRLQDCARQVRLGDRTRTKRLTQDTCAEPLAQVTHDVVIVDDFRHHRTIRLAAPHKFLSHRGRGG